MRDDRSRRAAAAMALLWADGRETAQDMEGAPMRDDVKNRAYRTACAEHPDRHASARNWSRFLFAMAELMTPDHPDYDLFVRSSNEYALAALEDEQ